MIIGKSRFVVRTFFLVRWIFGKPSSICEQKLLNLQNSIYLVNIVESLEQDEKQVIDTF